jgi:transketolase
MIDLNQLKKQILDVAYKAKKGHIGSALSVSDLLGSIFNSMHESGKFDEEKNSVTLSKGHAALALYCCLAQLNLISTEALYGYEKDGSLLGTHPDPELPWVNFIGGSLGQGIAFAGGLALADKYSGKQRNHYVILSDSELNAGVIWEIATFAGTKKLNNLIVLLDKNQQQALDLTRNILIYEDIATSFEVLGWAVSEIDGHNKSEISVALKKTSDKPHLIIANTKFGAGISFMDGNISWHYLPLNEEQYNKANEEIESTT